MILNTILKRVNDRQSKRLWAPRIITINHGSSFAENIGAGEYDHVDPDVTEKHFPLRGQGNGQVEIMFFHFNKAAVTYTYEVIDRIEDAGFRCIGIEELFAIGEQHPNLQRIAPIAALGSIWQNPFDRQIIRSIPCLYSNGQERELGLMRFACGYWLYQQWPEDWCFPAIRRV
jgi:hypothetical protein